MRIVEAVRHANRPGPPEHSVMLRVAAGGSVGVGIVACWAQGELSGSFTAVALAMVVVGNAFSYRRRERPFPYVKLLLAAAMIGAFVWFFVTLSADASTGNLGSIEGLLATLFTAMQAAHSFDVPARRDLGFSLAGSATLMAVAAAQAVDLRFGALVVVWAGFVVAGLSANWGSMAGGARARPAGIALAVLVAVVVGGVLVAFLPAPRPAGGLVAPSSTTAGPGPTAQPSRLVPADTSSGASRAASASGPTGVGGFLGFAGPLDTAVRGALGNQVVLQVRADRPTFWIAETFDSWSGQSWTETNPAGQRQWATVTNGPPFAVPAVGSGRSGAAAGGVQASGQTGGADGPVAVRAQPSLDYQTFYLATSGSDLVLHASSAAAVWFPTRKLFVSADGTIKADTALGAGSIYTVLSEVTAPTPAALRSANGTAGLSPAVVSTDLQLPHPYTRVAALARRITAGRTTVYGKVAALEDWIGDHTRYTTDIPPLRPGQDTVDQFLFGSRRGYCEQISTSLTVMLRTLGIPAREATGYVPGPYDPLTDLYEVQAKDAHAWVQVWFPGYGWESFDPTAYVPLANPTPGEAIGHDLAVALARVPVVPTVPVAAGVLTVVALVVWRRRRPATWRAAVTRDLVAAAARSGLVVGPGDTLGGVARWLDVALGGRLPVAATGVAASTEVAAWGLEEPDRATTRRLVHEARHIRRAARRAVRRDRLLSVVSRAPTSTSTRRLPPPAGLGPTSLGPGGQPSGTAPNPPRLAGPDGVSSHRAPSGRRRSSSRRRATAGTPSAGGDG